MDKYHALLKIENEVSKITEQVLGLDLLETEALLQRLPLDHIKLIKARKTILEGTLKKLKQIQRKLKKSCL